MSFEIWYRYPIRIRRKLRISAKYLSADIYPRISDGHHTLCPLIDFYTHHVNRHTCRSSHVCQLLIMQLQTGKIFNVYRSPNNSEDDEYVTVSMQWLVPSCHMESNVPAHHTQTACHFLSNSHKYTIQVGTLHRWGGPMFCLWIHHSDFEIIFP